MQRQRTLIYCWCACNLEHIMENSMEYSQNLKKYIYITLCVFCVSMHRVVCICICECVCLHVCLCVWDRGRERQRDRDRNRDRGGQQSMWRIFFNTLTLISWDGVSKWTVKWTICFGSLVCQLTPPPPQFWEYKHALLAFTFMWVLERSSSLAESTFREWNILPGLVQY